MRKSVWIGPKLDASTYGSELLNSLFNVTQINFSFPKSIYAVKECLESLSNSKYAHFLDYFAGSGTTGHAVVDMNRDDNGFRKFSLVEQGEYFILLPCLE
ncbi:putative DNA modification methylase [Escherichia coli]|uniref:Putative DNA modification methylase n=1 Tax=Escherichia coli TaxID=562 RepID=A0A447X925_ECOLX|nr:putative DNA modification methylase [Escherichia coli]